MSSTDGPHPILLTLDVEEILVLTTLIETFRITCESCDIPCPREVKLRIAHILEKMVRELEFQTTE